jgi:hypothetical protein
MSEEKKRGAKRREFDHSEHAHHATLESITGMNQRLANPLVVCPLHAPFIPAPTNVYLRVNSLQPRHSYRCRCPCSLLGTGKSHAELEADAEQFAKQFGLTEHVAELKKGAIVAQGRPDGEFAPCHARPSESSLVM